MSILTSSLIYLASLKEVWSFADGAGGASCSTRYPAHGYPFQDSDCPYQLTVRKQYMHITDSIEVKVTGTLPHRGFMIQALHKSEPSPLGKFYNNPSGVNMDCGLYLENTMTHNNNSLKNTSMFLWEPVQVKVEYVKFYATVVYNISMFWLDLKTPKVYIIENTSHGRLSNIFKKRRNDTYFRYSYRPQFKYTFPSVANPIDEEII